MTTSNLFQQCSEAVSSAASTSSVNSSTNDTTVAMLACIADQLQREVVAKEALINEVTRSVLLVLCGALVFIMQAGFAMLCAGCVRKKNIQNTMLKNLLDACGAALAFFIFGFAFAFGGTYDVNNPMKTFVGTSHFFLFGYDDYAFWFFQYSFSAASTTIVAGAIAERCQMSAYLCYSMLLSGWVYPIIVRSIWSPQGFLSAYNAEPLWDTGVVDFAGASVVHITGGLTALFACIILGPRRGRFHDDEGVLLEEPRHFRGSSDALQMLGTFLLWFGWYGFNGGNAILFEYNAQRSNEAALTAVNSTLSAGAGGITCILLNFIYLERTCGEGYFDVAHLRNGALSGLVAITSGCALVEPWAAWVIGMIAGVSYLISNRILLWFRIDDAVDAIPVHLTNGILSLIMTGLLANPTRLLDTYGRNTHVGLFYSLGQGNFDLALLGTQMVGIIFVAGWVMFFMLPFFTLLDYLGMFRSDPLEEIVGLDTSYHGGLALMNAMHVDDSNNDSFNEHMDEFKRRREEAKRTRLRILQKLKEEAPADNDIVYRSNTTDIDTPNKDNTRHIGDPASGNEMSHSETSDDHFH